MSKLQTEVKKSLSAMGQEIIQKLRTYSQLHSFNYGSGLPIPDKLTVRTGRLSRMLWGTGARSRSGSIAVVESSGDGVHIEWGAESPDIALHEFGGTRPITDPMRRFYWAQYFNDPIRKQMWLRLALFKDTVTYPARRPIGHASDAAQPEIKKIIESYLEKIIKIHQQIVASGAQKAKPL